MSKYYTPTIEEFHVGFEFESKYVLFSRDLDWKTITLNDSHDWFWDSYRQDAVETEFRVKHLDREDIESLGFSNYRKATDDWYDYIPEHRVQPFSLSYGAFRLTYGKEDRRLKIMGYEYDFKSDEEVLFCGLIKNKSELKRLLKQLNICT